MPYASCHVLLRKPVDLTAGALAAAWRATWAGRTGELLVTETRGTLRLDVGGRLRSRVLVRRTPLGDGRAPGCAHGAYATVFASGDHAFFACSTAASTAAAVLAATGGVGVFVPGARTLVAPDVWTEVTRGNGWSIPLWVGLVASREGLLRRRSAAYTVGLGALGLREVEVVGSREDPGTLRSWLTDLAVRVVHGAVLADGDTIGGGEDERVVVRHAPSAFGRPGTVYLLDAGRSRGFDRLRGSEVRST